MSYKTKSALRLISNIIVYFFAVVGFVRLIGEGSSLRYYLIGIPGAAAFILSNYMMIKDCERDTDDPDD